MLVDEEVLKNRKKNLKSKIKSWAGLVMDV